MKKIKIIVLAVVVFSFPPLLLLLTMLSGGGSASVPIPAPASKEKADHYAAVASELGVPWEIVVLSDFFYAHKEKQENLEKNNALVTSTEFLVLSEVKEEEEAKQTGVDDKGKPIYTYVWKYKGTTYYKGKAEILSYAGISEEELKSLNPSTLISSLQKAAEDKSSSSVTYTISFSANPDITAVLKNQIGIPEEEIPKIMELYESKYLQNLYFASGSFDYNIKLPPITVGNATRKELIEVAVTLLGMPYNWGGKSPHVGPPKNNLDCSGYVDWVYIQCFGRGVNGGTTPDNIIQNGTSMQFYSCQEIEESEMKIGDLGFVHRPEDVVDYNHVGIYVGEIDGYKAFIHCGGSSYGTADSPTGRVGVSLNHAHGKLNSKDPFGGEFAPAMKSINFNYFRRPQFSFSDDHDNE